MTSLGESMITRERKAPEPLYWVRYAKSVAADPRIPREHTQRYIFVNAVKLVPASALGKLYPQPERGDATPAK